MIKKSNNKHVKEEERLWHKYKSLIDDQLKLQVKLQFYNHHLFLKNTGLSTCNEVLDLGTGNGHFLVQLAKQYPNIQFIGVDNKKQMIEEARKHQLKNINWIYGNANDEHIIKQIKTAEGILMRYFLLHLQYSQDFLHYLYNTLKNGARIWIMDLDLEHYKASPANEAFDNIKKLIKRYCKQHGQDYNIGGKLPSLLKEVGFESITQEWDSLNTDEADIKLLKKFITQEVMLYQAFTKKRLNKRELDDIKKYISELNSSGTFLNYGVMMIAAMKRQI